MKEFELTMRLRNNLIKKRRLALGLSVRQAAEAAGVGYASWLELEGLRTNAISTTWRKKWTPTATKVARFLGVTEEELFPAAITAVTQPNVTAEISSQDIEALAIIGVPDALPATPYELLEELQCAAVCKKTVADLVGTLSRREQRVIKMRYEQELTFEKVGKRLGICAGRAQQLEARALRKLRHPSRANKLREFA